MKISVVTISYNQAEYLQASMDSVAAQNQPWEHILVDPGSTDGSRELVDARASQFSHILYEADDGPADGLNRGFARATGDIFYFLNSDDVVLPGTFDVVRNIFTRYPEVDIVAGHGHVIDANGGRVRRLWSDPPTRMEMALGTAILIQPSTFFRAEAFREVGGFNKSNRTNWDGELFVDMFMAKRRFMVVNQFLSEYRIHSASITGSAALDAGIRAYGESRFRKILGRDPTLVDSALRAFFRMRRLARNPTIIVERILRGAVYGGATAKKSGSGK